MVRMFHRALLAILWICAGVTAFFAFLAANNVGEGGMGLAASGGIVAAAFGLTLVLRWIFQPVEPA